eukprot:COSAG02_NODE_15066_length_1208_cov_1.270514_1_plen_158_part_00
MCGNCQNELTHAAAPRRQASSNDTDRLRRPKVGKSKRKSRDRESVRLTNEWTGAVAGAAAQDDPRHEPESEPHSQSEEALDPEPEEAPLSTSMHLEEAKPEAADELMQLEYHGAPTNTVTGRGGTKDIAVLDDGSVRRVRDSSRRSSKSGTKLLKPP